jgi:N-acyl-D-amino-acid deacylase
MAVILVALALLGLWQCAPPGQFDLVIRNGKILAGDGNPWFVADVGIRGDRIEKIGRIPSGQGKQEIDASGLFVVPGFIDIHTHADRRIDDIPTADNYLLQGVTTVVGGNCGGHDFPLAELFARLEKSGIAINFCSLIGHNTIRRQVMGLKMADPAPEEMKKMKELLDQEFRAGGIGFSTGLAYMPGTYAKTEELIELASVAAKYDGLYASHIRNQGTRITEAIEEAIRIGEANGIRVQISHIKLANDRVWGELERITRPVEEARKRGVEVFLDQYPYTATSSGFGSSIPSWALEGGHDAFVKRLEDPDTYRKIREGVIRRRLVSSKGINKLKTIYIARYRANPEYEGKNLEEILRMRGQKPTVENAADLIIEIQKNGGAQGVFFQMDEADVEALMRLDYNMIASDGGIIRFGDGVPHPRSYGTFPRVISRYVREKGVLTLPDAIRKMTSLPAQMLRLNRRGLIAEGYYADVVIFDFANIRDTATYSKPHQYPEGIRYVIVNGKIAAKDGKPTGVLAGRVLYGAGKK